MARNRKTKTPARTPFTVGERLVLATPTGNVTVVVKRDDGGDKVLVEDWERGGDILVNPSHLRRPTMRYSC